MRCSKCGTENPEGQKFCNECAAPFKTRCPKCGYENAPTAKFCGECAVPLQATRTEGPTNRAAGRRAVDDSTVSVAAEGLTGPPADGERKTVTALFADIKGSTELEQDLDPEEARAIVDPALKLMIDAVQRYDGYVVQSTGDGIFAIFGAPVAHEEHPQRALYSALRMQDELRRYSTKLVAEGGNPLQCRVGVNTGEVVVRSISTGGGHTEYTPIGHTTNLASRMQAVAPVGSIAVAEATRKLCEGYFTLKPLGPTKVRGVSEPVNVYEVAGLGPLRTRLQRAAGRGLTKFVGRERELDAIKHAAELSRASHGQIVAAVAEAGTGKSRLFFEFKVTSQSGWMVLETFSVSHGKASAYFPLIELLHGYFGIDAGDDSRKRREKVTGRVVALARSLEDTLPYLFGLLGIAEGDDPLAQMDEQLKRRRTLDAIKQILLRESLNQPLMVVFEDLHWIDEETQAFLNLLVDSIATSKILLLVNYRPEYSHQWNSKTYYTQLRLDPLGKESAEEMLAALLGDGADLAPLKRVIVEKTEGNPFFMEETVQVLLDEGALVREAGTVKLIKAISALKIPPTVQGILAARIDRLAPSAKDLLQTLSVIGREFPVSLVSAVVQKPEDELDRMLTDLQLGEFIYEQPSVGDTEYVFKHALTQEVAYNSVLIGQRKYLHERVATALERLYANSLEEHLPELAHHYGRSANVDAAVQYLTSAGKQKMEEALRLERSGPNVVSVGAPNDSPSKINSTAIEDSVPGARGSEATTAAPAAFAGDKEEANARRQTAVVGSVEAIWRYPVKSMAGEGLASGKLTEHGLLGDRMYALVDRASNRVAMVRRWAAGLLSYHAEFVTEPEAGGPPPALRITFPDGLTLTTLDADLHKRLSAVFGRDLTLMSSVPAGLLAEVPKGTLGGAHVNVTEVPLAAGSFFDYGRVHLIASSTLDHLQATYPRGQFDVRRFRPNIVIRSEGEPFFENSWCDRLLAVGDEVILRVTIPCPRCLTIMLPQDNLPHDPGILRTVAQLNMQDLGEFGTLPCAGVYADVARPGIIRRGDSVWCLD
jgi:class 3 adenylate cyclase/uncharacterized protein YcbX